MKVLTLNVSGLNFANAFKTVVTKIISPEADSKIILETMPHVELSLGGESANDLKIEKGSQISVKPVEGSTDGSFQLEIGEKAQPKTAAAPARAGSPAARITLSNVCD